ncbi:Uncharacterized protein Tcan_03831 [Toxocara canis]|uniref:Bestrophin homolog n=1 Tax=Toxocara canis TaxID=6265 RepID=A0A0B2VHF1_TOXCA|nr:Uncharacterized protein Tcan_03831 [Toxocara canis]
MTISYQLDVSSLSTFSFFRLLFRWKASVWKLVLKDLIVWTCAFLFISIFYRSDAFLTPQQKVTFAAVAKYCEDHLKYIPLTFIVGFFVSNIASRWTVVFDKMGYAETQALYIANYIRGNDDETRILRRTLVRYLCLMQVLVFRDISVPVRKRFPTLDSIMKAGFLLQEEKEKLESNRLKYDTYWMPSLWMYTLIWQAKKNGRISHNTLAMKLCDEVKKYRSSLQMVCTYDWVPLPLVYAQAIFLAIYCYFGICLISRQFTEGELNVPNTDTVDPILPVMTTVQFFFIIGWVKIAQGLLNPFGEDDDDFECNYLIDKNFATSLCIVDDQCDNVPDVKTDRFWRNNEAKPLYSIPSLATTDNQLIGSAIKAKLEKSEGETEMVVRKTPAQKSGASSRKSSVSSREISKNLRKRWRKFHSWKSMRCSLEVWPTYSTDIIREVNARLQVLEQTDTTSTHCTSRLSRSISEDHDMKYSAPSSPDVRPMMPFRPTTE